MAKPQSIKELMDNLPSYFDPDRAKNVNVIINFLFSGVEQSSWSVTISNGTCSVVGEGQLKSNVHLQIISPSDVWLKIVRGEIDGATAFMSGQFTFRGDMGVLMKMNSWFNFNK